MKKTKRTVIKKGRDSTAVSKRRFLLLFGQHKGNISNVCAALHMSRATFYEWLKGDEVFKASYDNEQEALIDHVESKLFDLIDRRDTTAIIFFLKTRAKARGYVERQEVTGANGGAIIAQFIMPRPMTGDKK